MVIKGCNEAVEKFVKEWKEKKGVEAIIFSGSHVLGYGGKYSDIDIDVITDKPFGANCGGLRKIDGFVFEVGVLTFREAYKKLGNNIKDNSKSDVRGMVFCRILCDKSGKGKRLKEKARKLLGRKFPKPSKSEVEDAKHELWVLNCKLKNVYLDNSPMFYHSYSLLLFRVIRYYGRFVGAEAFSFVRYYKYLTDSEFRKKFLLEEHPDRVFVRKLINCIEEGSRKKMLKCSDDLVVYVHKKMGGFD